MIAYRDFRPKLPGFIRWERRIKRNFDQALDEANAWIDFESIDVLNIETIGMYDSAFEVRFIRVWYRAAPLKSKPTSEL